MSLILYDPIEGDIDYHRHHFRQRTCFLMTKLGKTNVIPNEAQNMCQTVKRYLRKRQIQIIDAGSTVKGKDFLKKIWEMIVSVPLGIAILHEGFDETTKENIFYELGMFQALGKETLVIKTPKTKVPSDFVRTEYIDYGKRDKKFGSKFTEYLNNYLKQAKHYCDMGDSFSKAQPFIALDYYARAFLISKDSKYLRKAKKIFDAEQPRIKEEYITNLICDSLTKS